MLISKKKLLFFFICCTLEMSGLKTIFAKMPPRSHGPLERETLRSSSMPAPACVGSTSITKWRPFYDENVTYTSIEGDDGFWKRSSPEEQGISSALLDKAEKELSSNIPSALSLLVIRNGILVRESYFHGSASNQSNNIHSASKGIIAALVGILVDRGVLDLNAKLGDLLPSCNLINKKQSQITLRHLLTMSAGFEWIEDETEYKLQFKKNWVKAITELKLESKPGASFNYSTAQSHLVSAIISQATGMTTEAFATENLFKPLGITISHWGHDPQQISSGGYNLFMTPRSLAKFALMHLNNGQVDGQQILPEKWVQETLTTQIDTGHDPGENYQYRYGHFWWITRIAGFEVKKLWGFGGQFAYLVPDLNMVVVITNDTHKIYDEMDGDSFMDNFIFPSVNRD